MNYISTKDAADKWGVSQRRVALLCEKGRIEGTTKVGKTWLIPNDAIKPEDGRHNVTNKAVRLYSDIEKKYRVIYPENKNATYTSLLNYSDYLEQPFQRWYRYKEGFSIDLVKQLISEYTKETTGVILDPFCGSGSTMLAANEIGFHGVGFEVNPFSYFLGKTKLYSYSGLDVKEFEQAYNMILKMSLEEIRNYELPLLSISEKVFQKQIEEYYMSISIIIDEIKISNEKIRDLLKLGWLSILENISNYRKAGNGLKIKKYVKPRVVTKDDIYYQLSEQYQNMYSDIKNCSIEKNAKIYNCSCMDMRKYVADESITGIIFSPPYANCFDYTEIYKLELWFGKFVQEYSDLKELRNKSLHSHLNGKFDMELRHHSKTLDYLLSELETKELWDRKIPSMLQLYYEDMFSVLDNCYSVLKKDGFCSIVVGNSAYGGVIFPADLILAEYAESIGFAVDKIEVDRYVITSSQQYSITKESSNYLRESVVCLIKK